MEIVPGLKVRVEDPRRVHLVALEQHRYGQSFLRTHQREGRSLMGSNAHLLAIARLRAETKMT